MLQRASSFAFKAKNNFLASSSVNVVVHTRPLSIFRNRRLPRLGSEADSNPGDANKQHEYMKALNLGYPQDVIARFNSGKYAVNDGVRKEYLKALVATGKIDTADLSRVNIGHNGGVTESHISDHSLPISQNLTRNQSYNGFSMGSNFDGGSGGGPVPVSVGETVKVAMQEPTMWSQFWRVVRTAVFGIIGFTALSSLMEERGLGKSGSLHSEVEPQAQTRKYQFDDIKGVDEAKEDLEEIVEFLRNPTKFTKLGGKLPKGVLLVGPPGTGKTLLARAIAGEADVPFFYCSGSEFDEMFVGVGARRVRDLFSAAKARQPCIIFIDEIDGIGGSRNPKDPNYCQMTLNQLLVEMDGFSQNDGVIVVGATNFPELLDKALVRPGRFDKHVMLPLPDVKGREEILKVHIKDIPMAEGVNLRTIARNTHGLSGAELANIVNQAALKASVENKRAVDNSHLEYARDKIVMGAERKSTVLEEANRRSVAFHEGGHALVAAHTAGALPLHKATIMPRGSALGMVTQLPENDMLNWSKQQLLATLDVCMGGRVAEEMIFGVEHASTGALSDLEKATSIARSMVTKYGFSEKIGIVSYEDESKLSGEVRKLIDDETRALCQAAYEKAQLVLKTNEKQLHLLANALLEKETLSSDEIYATIGMEKPRSSSNIK